MELIKEQTIQILKFELSRRQKANPRYSMRSFAQFLDIDVSLLSKVLRGQRSLGAQSQQKCLKKLNIKPADLIANNSELSKDYSFVDSDQFKLLSEGHHYSILELLKEEKYKKNPSLLAKKFNSSAQEIKQSLKLLERVGFIYKKDEGYEIGQPDHSLVTPASTSFARREYLKSIFNSSVESIDKIDISERDHSALTVLASRSQIDEIKKEINKFRRKIDVILEKQSDKDDVYQLAIGFFPVTQKGET